MTMIGREAAPASFSNLDRWRSADPVLLLVTLLLSAYGIFAVYVAGTSDREAYAVNQSIGFAVGLAGAIPLALIDYRFWQRLVKPIYLCVLLMLLAVLVVGVAAGGAQRWIDVGPVQVQPSEFAKLMMVIVLAGYFAGRAVGDAGVFVRSLGVVGAPALLVFLQPDLGTALVFGAVFVVMAYVGGARLWQLGALGAAGALAAALALRFRLLEEYQIARLTAFLDPESAGEIGYQVTQSKLAIGSGGLTGKGLDATTLANLGFLPEDHTDFIFANLAERVGFAGSFLLLLLFFLLIWRILHIATISRDRFGVLISVGVATIFLFHVFVNVGMTMGIMPVTGIPLPFISYGRSSLVVSVLSLGLLQSVAMRSRAEVAKHPKP
ncbi:cell cycle protein [Rubrobacter xylanophilus DSM 9941]|uniref:Peptidoglycan glycosyltransferase RodA n=2 Tax=Rubrobacter xylanophilus TaxID=49319 RepID=Q1AVU0_RUBXD|nr:cell cycle protein [Rubrobacter xylanophilus DSM 9941]